MDFETYINNLKTKLLSKSCSEGTIGCIIWKGGVSGKYGITRYTPFKSPASKVIRVHRLQFMLHTRNFDLSCDMHVSHLCHYNMCIAPEHLSYEPKAVNLGREKCKHTNPSTCYGHHGYPNCIF